MFGRLCRGVLTHALTGAVPCLEKTKIWERGLTSKLKVMLRVSCARRLGSTLWELSTSSERFFISCVKIDLVFLGLWGRCSKGLQREGAGGQMGNCYPDEKVNLPPKKASLQQILIQSSWPAMPRTSSLTWGRRPCHLLAKIGWKGCRSSLESFTFLKQ